jgi:Trk K+ transport system NAD-binding subunit
MLVPRQSDSSAARSRPGLQTWIDQYQLTDREYRLRVTFESSLVGKRLEELSLRAAGINIVAIVRSLRLGTEMIRPVARHKIGTVEAIVHNESTLIDRTMLRPGAKRD